MHFCAFIIVASVVCVAWCDKMQNTHTESTQSAESNFSASCKAHTQQIQVSALQLSRSLGQQ